MTTAWTTVPHVTQGDKADITELEGLRQKYAKRVEAAGGKLTVTAIAVKVIASALKVKLAPAAERRLPKVGAYEAYLKYRSYQWKFTPEATRRSRECLEQAIAIDPEFALPYVGLADSYLAISSAGGVPSHEAMPRARELASRALEIDSDLPEAHAMLGIVAGHYDYDWVEADKRFAAARRDQMSPHLRQWHAQFHLLAIGRRVEGVAEHRRVLEEDPLCQTWHYTLGTTLHALGRHEDAIAEMRKAVEIDSDFGMAPSTLRYLASKTAEAA